MAVGAAAVSTTLVSRRHPVTTACPGMDAKTEVYGPSALIKVSDLGMSTFPVVQTNNTNHFGMPAISGPRPVGTSATNVPGPLGMPAASGPFLGS
jgi:hypothetical protein